MHIRPAAVAEVPVEVWFAGKLLGLLKRSVQTLPEDWSSQSLHTQFRKKQTGLEKRRAQTGVMCQAFSKHVASNPAHQQGVSA